MLGNNSDKDDKELDAGSLGDDDDYDY